MKKVIAMLVLVAGSGIAGAAELGGLRAADISKAEFPAEIAAPEAVPAAAAAVEKAVATGPVILQVTSKEMVELKPVATYAATSGLPMCTEGSFSDGGYKRLPKVYDQEIPVRAASNVLYISFDRNVPGVCGYELAGFTLRVNHPKVAQGLNEIGLQLSDRNQDGVAQKMVFKKIQSPWLGEVFTISGEHILVGPSGRATVELVF